MASRIVLDTSKCFCWQRMCFWCLMKSLTCLYHRPRTNYLTHSILIFLFLNWGLWAVPVTSQGVMRTRRFHLCEMLKTQYKNKVVREVSCLDSKVFPYKYMSKSIWKTITHMTHFMKVKVHISPRSQVGEVSYMKKASSHKEEQQPGCLEGRLPKTTER